MKKNILNFLLLLIMALFVSSCGNEDTVENNKSEETTTLQSKSGEDSLNSLLKDLKSLADSEGKRVAFDLGYNGNIYTASNVRVIEDDFAYDFSIGFNSEDPLEPGTVTISCDTGSGDPTVTNCPPNSYQGMCVGTATADCLDAGGCATTCKVPAVVTPSNTLTE